MTKHSKKGRLAGEARKAINESRASDAINVAFMTEKERAAARVTLDFVFGRVTKLTGANHARVAIATKHGSREVNARIPNIYARRGATPVAAGAVVTLFTGPDFDPDAKPTSASTEHYDISAILTSRQITDLRRADLIPDWMPVSNAAIAKDGKVEEVLFEFVSGSSSGEEKDGAAAAGAGRASAVTGFSRSGSRYAPVAADADEEFDIADI